MKKTTHKKTKKIQNEYCEFCSLDFNKCRQRKCDEAKLKLMDDIENMMFPNGRDLDSEDW